MKYNDVRYNKLYKVQIHVSVFSFSEVQCSLSSQVRYRIHAYWGVSIRELHIYLWRPWSAIRDACLRDELLKGESNIYYYQQIGLQVE